MNIDGVIQVTLTCHEVEVLFAYWAREYFTEWAWAIEEEYGLDFHATERAQYHMDRLVEFIGVDHANRVLREVRDEFETSSLPTLQINTTN